MIPAMIASVETMLEKWKGKEGKEMEVFQEFRFLTSEVISRTAFGSSYLEGEKIFDMLMKLTLIIGRNFYKAKFAIIGKFWRSADEIESDKLEKTIHDSVMKIVKQREEKVMTGEVDSFGHDFLGLLYWQDKARTEVIEVFGNQNPNSEGIAKLKTVTMIINESLRLYPPLNGVVGKAVRDVQLGKLVLPNYLDLNIRFIALHHDPDLWGDDVLLFKPERSAEGIAKATNNNAAAFMPFGLGPRSCVGMSFCNH
ncbi:hypothetical protein J1N35_043316 [Gossypium stocksii]|uniref:Cytochrome P450 n=1 Tax=Gossypium stocksii TaxID=47602 RepID=A0A9D3U749_9ROSI|nr:hypothetical protein J1N35_043316 [Gossypium stocksii]